MELVKVSKLLSRKKKYVVKGNLKRRTIATNNPFSTVIMHCICMVKAICLSAISNWLNVVVSQLNTEKSTMISKHVLNSKNCS